MLDDATIAPIVPPITIRNAGMLMNDIGFPPSITTATSRNTTAMPMPAAVVCFMAFRSVGRSCGPPWLRCRSGNRQCHDGLHDIRVGRSGHDPGLPLAHVV